MICNLYNERCKLQRGKWQCATRSILFTFLQNLLGVQKQTSVFIQVIGEHRVVCNVIGGRLTWEKMYGEERLQSQGYLLKVLLLLNPLPHACP